MLKGFTVPKSPFGQAAASRACTKQNRGGVSVLAFAFRHKFEDSGKSRLLTDCVVFATRRGV